MVNSSVDISSEILTPPLGAAIIPSILTSGPLDPASHTNASLVTNKTTSSSARTRATGLFTVAGWTWDASNAIADGSILSGDEAISSFPSSFLFDEGQPLAQETVGNILLGQPNGSLALGNDDTTRSQIELTWGGLGLPNGLGNDFVVYENGNPSAPEGYAVAVRLAGSDTFTNFRYEFFDTYEDQVIGDPDAGVLATAFDLSDFGLSPGQSIDAIQIINLLRGDLVNGQGQGFLSTVGTSPLDISTGLPFAPDKFDPDITFVAGLQTLIPLEDPVVPSLDIRGTGDFNGDGQTDILLRNQGTGENVVWLMNGTTISQVVDITPVADPNWVIGGTGDFNSDGQTDILWQNNLTDERSVWLMNGTELAEAVEIISPDDINWKFVGTGDFNSDGQTDILLRNTLTGDDSVWLMNGTELTRGVYTAPQHDLNWVIGGTGDFNGDGQIDILWRNQATGDNITWLMDRTELATGIFLDSFQDPDWVIGGTGDFNGDGQVDIVWQNDVTDESLVWLMNGTDLAGTSDIT
jgi:hypothetical protein